MKEQSQGRTYLLRVRAADIHIKVLEDELLRYRAELAAPRSNSYIADRVSGGMQFAMSEQVIRIIDLQRDIAAEWSAMIQLRTEARELIMLLDDTMYRAILLERYINCMSWNKIADRLHYGQRWLMQIHAKALQAFDLLYRKK